MVAASVPAESPFDASADGSTVAYSSHERAYVWQAGHTTRVAGPPAFGRVMAISGDGSLVAYDTGPFGHQGTEFYSVASGRHHFLPGYVISGRPDAHQQISADGRYVLLLKGTDVEGRTGPGVIYDRVTGRFQRLPRRPGFVAEGRAISPDGRVVLIGELKAYRGEVNADLYSRQTGKRVTLRFGAQFIHWLSADGSVLISEADPWRNGAPSVYNRNTGGSTLPLIGSNGLPASVGGFTPVSLSGDGDTIAFSCQESLFLYQLSSGSYRTLARSFFGGPFRNAQERFNGATSTSLTAMVTTNGNAVVFDASSPPSKRGLYELPTAAASPSGGALPSECED